MQGATRMIANSRYSQFCERALKLHIFHTFVNTCNLMPTTLEQRENRINCRNYDRAKQNIDIFVNCNWADTRWQ